MKHSLTTGFSFGITSAIITTLGLMVGLHSGTHSRVVVLGGILTIAVADAFSDALGIHVSEESENKHSTFEIWVATLSTFFAKFFFAMTFVLPIMAFRRLGPAIIVSVVYGLSLLGVFSYFLAKAQKGNPWKVVFEHLIIALIVIGITHSLGDWIGARFRM
jgi:VIT1/CCC1 family predicted Fe2+/Mn2+ transporter